MTGEREKSGLDLARFLPDPAVVRLLPRAVALRYLVAPLTADTERIQVAMRDVADLEALDHVELITKRRVEAVAAPEEQVRELIQRIYSGGTGVAGGSDLEATVLEATRLAEEKVTGTELPVVRLVDQILAEALRHRATDIHVQPEEGYLAVRFRVDGALRTIFKLPSEVQSPLSTRLKILANLDISERRLPQDGKIELESGLRRADLRVSTLPTVHGENLVLRVLDHAQLAIGFPDLGFQPGDIVRIEQLAARPNGILLVTGPTGSGKTTTLYAALQCLDTERLNVMTLEDPVEYRLPGIRQAQIAEKVGFHFATGLRALLRQDPDVILLGEMRDRETAEIAVRAALTGHLVLSTLHTNGSLATLARLRDLGLEDYLVGSTLIGVLAQRLMRRVCPECAREAEASQAERQFLGLGSEPVRLKKAVGCAHCAQSGYHGRFAVYELLEISERLARAIGAGSSLAELEDAARAEGFVELRALGVSRVLAGWTTVDELARVVA